MIKEFNSIEEIKKYYDKKTNTYIFKEDGEYINLIKFNFNLNIASSIDAKDIESHNIHALDINACDINAWNINAHDIFACNVHAWDINACNIDAWDINAGDINAWDIYAGDISSFSIVANNIVFSAVCFAYESIKCDSIKSRRENAKFFVLDGNIEIKED